MLTPESHEPPLRGAGDMSDTALKETHDPPDKGECYTVPKLEGIVLAARVHAENKSPGFEYLKLSKAHHTSLTPCHERL